MKSPNLSKIVVPGRNTLGQQIDRAIFHIAAVKREGSSPTVRAIFHIAAVKREGSSATVAQCNARYKTADGGLTSVGLNWCLTGPNYEDMEAE